MCQGPERKKGIYCEGKVLGPRETHRLQALSSTGPEILLFCVGSPGFMIGLKELGILKVSK